MIQSAASHPILSARNIHKYYGALHVLQGVDLDIHAGEIVSMVGPSGSGKSTLLHILGTLDEPAEGEIRLKNLELHSLKGKSLAAFRNQHIGFVFQFHFLMMEFSALDNVAMPLRIRRLANAAQFGWRVFFRAVNHRGHAFPGGVAATPPPRGARSSIRG